MPHRCLILYNDNPNNFPHCNPQCAFGVSASVVYRWQEQFLAEGRAALGDRRGRNRRDPIAENHHLEELVGQQTVVTEAQERLTGLLPLPTPTGNPLPKPSA
ncbi:MAG: helix-turn-helix domain-containing protein [Dehalococcoidia bacterium]